MKSITTTKTGEYFGLVRGVVTRNILCMPKPQCPNLTDKNGATVNSNNIWDVQVWIPSIHTGAENFQPDLDWVGTEDTYGKYPWCPICGPLFKDQIGYEDDEYPDIWSSMFYGKYMEDVPSTYPGIGDTVFLLFENGELSKPVVMGSMLCDGNSVKYRKPGYSGSLGELNLSSRVEGRTLVTDNDYID